ncbi:putative transposase, partial [Skermanella aerolata]|uniref:transposase n=1 Tax=Skermanella aerolata TaxID=393310 RepID=UPI003D2499B9
PNPISVNHPYAATSDILILFVALFIQFVAPYFETGPWGEKYVAIGKAWRRAWQEVIPFFAFPREVRRILYTTNAIEALNSKLRRAVRARGHFPNDEAALKLLFLVLNRAEKDWKMPPREWTAAKAQMAVIFGDRFAKAMTA